MFNYLAIITLAGIAGGVRRTHAILRNTAQRNRGGGAIAFGVTSHTGCLSNAAQGISHAILTVAVIGFVDDSASHSV